jgi:hypothetical protein
MTTRRLTAAICFGAVAFLSTMQFASAARIYNFLNVPVEVQGQQWFKLAPGQKSESLGWSTHTGITIADAVRNKAISGFNWGWNAEMQGGNYLVISVRDHRVSCVMCNASHGVTHVSEGTLPSFIEPYTSPHHGC